MGTTMGVCAVSRLSEFAPDPRNKHAPTRYPANPQTRRPPVISAITVSISRLLSPRILTRSNNTPKASEETVPGRSAGSLAPATDIDATVLNVYLVEIRESLDGRDSCELRFISKRGP